MFLLQCNNENIVAISELLTQFHTDKHLIGPYHIRSGYYKSSSEIL